jgi:hypothetical protein
MRAWQVWAAGLAVGEAACAAHGGHLAAPWGGSTASWQYEVLVDAAVADLRVDAWLPRGSLSDLVVRRGAEPFVERVQVEKDGGWRDVQRRGAVFHAPECAQGCHLHYHFALRSAARTLVDTDMAIAWGDVVEASPSVWLLHPTLAPSGVRYRFHVDAPPAVSFATGIFAVEDGPPNSYEAEASNISVAPYAAFGNMRMRRVEAVAGVRSERRRPRRVGGRERSDDGPILRLLSS